MAYPILLKDKVVQRRKQGNSLNELHSIFGVSKSTLSLWLRDVRISDKAKTRLLRKITVGQYVSAENKKKKTQALLKKYFDQAINDINKIHFNRKILKLICSLIYWCEGAKDQFGGVMFTNSDPNLIRTFLVLFRNSFNLDENKFRACIHLHSYHDPNKQLQFWSQITKIPTSRFIKPFLKKNTGKRIREGYPGCISIRYHSNDIARQLLTITRAFFKKHQFS